MRKSYGLLILFIGIMIHQIAAYYDLLIVIALCGWAIAILGLIIHGKMLYSLINKG